MTRLVARRSGAPSSTLGHTRIEVCPPEVWPSSLSWRGRLARLRERWVQSLMPWVPQDARPVNRLALVKVEFSMSLNDLLTDEVDELLARIDNARSLRELWHLRSSVYGVVATARNQIEAERRLAQLNRHFPTRAPRSGFVPLDS